MRSTIRTIARYTLPAGLIAAWMAVLMGMPAFLPTQPASWLTFLALLIAPGYLLGDLIAWRLNLDWLERLALAFPLGIAVLAIPGVVALLRHWTITDLTLGWSVASAGVLLLWMLQVVLVRPMAGLLDSVWVRLHPHRETPDDGWAVDEFLMLLLLMLVFAALIPLFTLYKIDGDAYAVSTFAADALAGRPLNAVEPLFGSDLGPGVRMVFNQSLPMAYLWSFLSGIDPITLTATASRAMIALWALLAAYTLGKAAGDSRRVGLLTASIQLMIYLAAPFLRGDSVSLFFFERTSADKFMVPVAMLPVVFALAIRFVRAGRRDVWVVAAVATVAVSVIHPLIAAMCALALGAFAGLHILVNLRDGDALRRGLAVWMLVALVMIVPFVQLILAQGEAPLAPSYPSSVEGWPLGSRMVPALPSVQMPTLDLYGPLPDLATLAPSDANTITNPFLIWRFAVNAERRRLLMFDIDQYISDPNLLMEPPYLLALALVPLLLWRIRSHPGVQFAIGTTTAILFVMFNPIVTPLIGSLSMPWILWRFVWLLPYALIIALAVHWLIADGFSALIRWLSRNEVQTVYNLSLPLLVGVGLMLMPGILRNVQNLQGRVAAPYFYPTPEELFDRLDRETAGTGPVMVLADQDVSVTIPAYVANADVVAHREPTTSEIFPADQQDVALRRLIDQHSFFHASYLTPEAIDILRRYDVRYVVTPSGSAIDTQLRLLPSAFEWLLDDHSYSLYRVTQIPSVTAAIEGNGALERHAWDVAERHFSTSLAQRPDDPLALYGMAEIAHVRGEFGDALSRLEQVDAILSVPHLAYRIGLLHAERGNVAESIAAFEQAQEAAPQISRFHVALGDACLRTGRETCTSGQYAAAAESRNFPDMATRRIAEADLWRRHGRFDYALPLYESAAQDSPSEYNWFVLVSAYREAGQFDEAERLLVALRDDHPLSADVIAVHADVLASRGRLDDAIDRYREALWLQTIQAQDPTNTHLALAQTLLEADRLDEAQSALDEALTFQPFNATAHRLQGDLFSRRDQAGRAAEAYQRALELDPTQIAVSTALRDQLRQTGRPPTDVLNLLRAALQYSPDETVLHVALGDQLQQQGDVTGAAEAYRAALDTVDAEGASVRGGAGTSSRAFVSARLAEAYEALGRIEPAMHYYRASVSADPTASWSRVLLGDALRRRNELDAAAGVYRDVITSNPTYLEAYLRLADLMSAQGNMAEAERIYRQASEVSAIDAYDGVTTSLETDVSRLAANVLDPTQFSEETLVAAAPPQPEVPSVPGDDDVGRIHTLVELYRQLGRFEEARTFYAAAIQQAEDKDVSQTVLARYYSGLADLYAAEGDRTNAINTYRVAMELDRWWPAPRLGLAQVLADSGNAEAAVRELRAAVERAPGSADVQVALAEMLRQQERRNEVLAIYERIAQTQPGNVQALLGLAHTWHAREQWDTAERYYHEAAAMAAGRGDIYVGLAELYIDTARYEDAEAQLHQALSIDRRNANAYVRFGDLERERGNLEQALDWYRQSEVWGASTQQTRLAVVDTLIEQGAYETALAETQTMVAEDPDNADVQLRLGRIHHRRGTYEDAIVAFEEASRLQPENAAIYVELASLYRDRGQLQNTRQLYQQAIDVDPDNASYYLSLGQVLVAQGEDDAAITLLTDALETVSEPAEIYASLSALYLQQARHEQAREVLEQGIATLGEEPALLLALGEYQEARAEFESAEETYRRVLERDSDAAPAYAALGGLYLRLDRSDDALAQYRQAVEAAPDNAVHRLELARAYAEAEQIEAATESYSDTIALAPTEPAAYVELAALYEEQEARDAARTLYERGLTMAPASGRLMVRYGGFLLARGEDERGNELLESAMEVQPTTETLLARAEMYQELDRLDEAERDLRAAAEGEQPSHEALIALGDLLAEQDETDAARELYQRAVSLRPGAAAGYLRLIGLALDANDSEQVEQYRSEAREAVPGALLESDDES